MTNASNIARFQSQAALAPFGEGEAEEARSEITNGDRVEAGKGEDHDIGTAMVVDRANGKAFVAWDSGVSTWSPLADLAPEGSPEARAQARAEGIVERLMVAAGI